MASQLASTYQLNALLEALPAEAGTAVRVGQHLCLAPLLASGDGSNVSRFASAFIARGDAISPFYGWLASATPLRAALLTDDADEARAWIDAARTLSEPFSVLVPLIGELRRGLDPTSDDWRASAERLLWAQYYV